MKSAHTLGILPILTFLAAACTGHPSTRPQEPGTPTQSLATQESASPEVGTQILVPQSDPAPGHRPGDDRPNFSGIWIINTALSDDPREKLAARGSQRQRGRGAGGGGQRARGSARPSARGGAGNALGESLVATKTLTIAHSEPLFELTSESGERRRIYTDNRANSVSALSDTNRTLVSAAWERNALVVESNPSVGPRLVQRYELIANGSRLRVRTLFGWSSSERNATIEQIYDATDPVPQELPGDAASIRANEPSGAGK